MTMTKILQTRQFVSAECSGAVTAASDKSQGKDNTEKANAKDNSNRWRALRAEISQ